MALTPFPFNSSAILLRVDYGPVIKLQIAYIGIFYSFTYFSIFYSDIYHSAKFSFCS